MISLFTNSCVWLFVTAGLFTISCIAFPFVVHKLAKRQKSKPITRVLFVTQDLYIGGVERLILILCRSLKERTPCFLSVFAYDHESRQNRLTLVPDFLDLEVPVVLFKKPAGFSPKVIFKLRRTVIVNDIEVLHCHDLGSLMYAVFVKWLLLGRVRVIRTEHSFIHLTRNPRYRLYEKFFTRWADEVTAVSEEVKQTYVALGVVPKRILLIENGVAFPSNRYKLRSEKLSRRTALRKNLTGDAAKAVLRFQSKFWLLYLARLDPSKGQDQMVALWNKLSPHARGESALFLIGPEAVEGELSRIKSLIAEAYDRERIILLGGTSAPQGWLEASDIYISCSASEGMPLGPLEAAGAGLPLILSQIAGHQLFRPASRQFSLSSIEDGATHIEDVLVKLSCHEESFQRETWDCSKFLRERFSADNMAMQYEQLYRKHKAQTGGR